MPLVDAKDIQKLIEQAGALVAQAESRRDEAKATVGTIKPDLDEIARDLGVKPGKEMDPAKWNDMDAEKREEYFRRLKYVVSGLREAVEDGPTDRRSLMFNEYASNASIGVLAGVAVAGIAIVLVKVHSLWPAALEGAGKSPPREEDVLFMVLLMGALGGFLHLASSLGQFAGNRKLKRSWVLYYLFLPFQGAALAAVVYQLLRVGVLAADSGTGGMNVMGIYAFAGLTGLFSKQALTMLADVFKVIFARVGGRDSIDKDSEAASAKSEPAPERTAAKE